MNIEERKFLIEFCHKARIRLYGIDGVVPFDDETKSLGDMTDEELKKESEHLDYYLSLENP